jgi:hypothetical protein
VVPLRSSGAKSWGKDAEDVNMHQDRNVKLRRVSSTGHGSKGRSRDHLTKVRSSLGQVIEPETRKLKRENMRVTG